VQILVVSAVADAYLALAANWESLKLAQSTLKSAGLLPFNSEAL
jgi:outer membrane protein TolC